MKRVYCILLSVSLLLSLILPSSGLAANVESFLQINDSVNRFLLASASYDLTKPVSVAQDYFSEDPELLEDQPAGFTIVSSSGGTVTVSDGSRTRAESATGSSYTIYNLIPGTVYHYRSTDASGTLLTEGDVTAVGKVRMIYSKKHVRNVRDLGGWSADGGTVRYNLLFRGASVNALGQEDQKMFRDWLNVQTQIDLREPDKTGLDGVTSMAPGTNYVNIDMRFEAFQTTEINLARYTALLNTVIDSVVSGKGVYFHCAVGSDRTGQAAFLLLGLLGVSPVDIARDYELSTFSRNERLWTSNEFQTMLLQMNAFTGKTFQDKCASFAQMAGVSLDRINAFRRAMIDGNPSELKPCEPRNGFYWDNGNLYYYENDEISGSGLMVLDGSYYYVSPTDQTLAHDGEYEVTVTNGLMPQGTYQFDSQGRMIIPPACGHLHTVINNRTEPTCTAGGYSGDTVCADCGETIAPGKVLPAVGHTLVRHDTKAPTETESGCITYWECSVCSRLFQDAAGRGEITAEDIVLAPVKCPSGSFTDVDRTAKSWYHEAVDWAVLNRITTGTSAATFSPNAECTREQMVTFLWRALGETKANRESCPFTDVKTGDYSWNAILWAYENGIVKGTAADKFSPKAPVTREQVVTILWRLAHEPAVEGGMPFPDVKAGYAFDAIRWAAQEGVSTGYEDGTFRPTRAVTRAEIVTLLRRALNS